jgi:hypothetical protein
MKNLYFLLGGAKKTPEYSGVFFRIFVTNIGFCQNQNRKKSLEFYCKTISRSNLKYEKPIFSSWRSQKILYFEYNYNQ